jgi:serine-type D-Ala-D-Ala carboxypeptidase (penicillin-binding protein 5/6)
MRHHRLRLISAAALVAVGACALSSPARATTTPAPTTAPAPTVTPVPTPAPTTPIPTPPVPTTPMPTTPLPTTPAPPTPTSTLPPPTVALLTVPATLTAPGPKPRLPWPKVGGARLEVAGVGVLGRSGDRRSVPIASVTKVMTAYLILRDHPLAVSTDRTAGARARNGPTIRVTRAEAASYARRRAAGESLVKLAAGQRITERQALQGLLLASGNNVADILARWDAGSGPAFVRRMNRAAAALHLTGTHYADACGLSRASRSTTADLLRLAPAAMADPVFAEIVGQTRATVGPVRIKNTNKLLGRHGIVGIKTGSTRAAGGCLLFAARRRVAGQTWTIYGVVLGAPGPLILTHALAESDRLVVAAGQALRSSTLIPAGTTVATVTAADGRPRRLVLARDLRSTGWAGLTYTLSLPSGLAPGQIPTRLTVRTTAGSASVPLTAI